MLPPRSTSSALDTELDYTPDLDAYFARIGDDGSREANLATLNRIVEAHVRRIPFENLDILIGRGISVEPADIERKLVHEGRGGYCFEQNSLLESVLGALGYEVRGISARVRIQQPRSFTPARTHLFLRVELDGKTWLVDVGVGALSLTSAIELKLDTPQETPHETRRIVATGDWEGFDQRSPDALLYHQVLFGDRWEDVCEFTLEEMQPIDRVLGNWYTSTHPDSHFGSRMTVARSSESGRVTLQGAELKHRGADGRAVSRSLQNDAEVLTALREEFGLDIPADAWCHRAHV